jgi:transaldolase
MDFFLDTAHKETIKKWREAGLIDGVTTNPSHLAKEGGDPLVLVRHICDIMESDPVSVEITETEPQAVYEQAHRIARIAPNVVVKVPCSLVYVPIISRLVKEEILVNVTLVFSVVQGLCMAKLGVAYISPFIGRLDDTDTDGVAVIEDLCTIIDHYGYESQVLAASLRSVRHIHKVAIGGADIATIPPALLEQALSHPLSDKGMALFLEDWRKLGVKQFP